MEIMKMKIYIASSWKNPRHKVIVRVLRERGAWIYDYRETNFLFQWDDLDPNYSKWLPAEYLSALNTQKATNAFWRDMSALAAADAVVGLDPLGVSSALELGWAVGHGKPAVLLVEDTVKPELMSKIIPFRVCNLEELIITLENIAEEKSYEKKN